MVRELYSFVPSTSEHEGRQVIVFYLLIPSRLKGHHTIYIYILLKAFLENVYFSYETEFAFIFHIQQWLFIAILISRTLYGDLDDVVLSLFSRLTNLPISIGIRPFIHYIENRMRMSDMSVYMSSWRYAFQYMRLHSSRAICVRLYMCTCVSELDSWHLLLVVLLLLHDEITISMSISIQTLTHIKRTSVRFSNKDLYWMSMVAY